MTVRHGGLTNSQALTYDPENRLSAIAQAGVFSDEFGYAYDDARLWKRINQNPTNVQVWIGNIYEEKGGKTLFHIFAGNEQVCTFETNSLLAGGTDTNRVGYFYTEDNLNTSSALSGSGAAQVEVNVYYPFGRTQSTSPQASFQVSRRFTGQVFDAESGLYYYNARYYDPELGRFIQPDTTVPDMSNPQSYNRYSYCVNDPLRYNDPTGHGPVADTLFNSEAIKSSYQLMTMHDTFAQKLWESPVGLIGMVANGLDAGFNMMSMGGKGFLEAGIKKGFKVGMEEIGKTEGSKIVKGGIAAVNKGKAGEKLSEKEAVAAGEKIRGKQVTFELPSGNRTRPDLLTETKQGKLKVREAKNGPTADLTPGQKELKQTSETGGSVIPRGQRAEAAGLKPGVPVKIPHFETDKY
jgi:RHS repeat-associated protein